MRIVATIAALLFGAASMAQEPGSNFERKNLGENVNSKFTEMTPRISADGQTLYFVRDGHPENKNQQDIWVAEMGADGHWKPAQLADKKINSLPANCVWSVNADGNTVLIRGAFEQGNYIRRGFSIARKTKDGWQDPQQIKIEEVAYIDHGENDGAYLSVDGNAIVFTLCEKLNCHVYDLYVSTKNQDGTFTKPKRLAGNINSDFNEFAPFLASDNKTLYFSSDRPGGLGQSDIYKCERLDSTWLAWSEPVNLGAPINTPEKDGYYVTDARGEYAYLVSEQNSFGGADIVRIKLTKEQIARPVILLNGHVTDAKTKKTIDATLEYNVYPDDVDEGVAHTKHPSGEYKLVLPYGENYAINVYAKGYVPYYDTISLAYSGEYKEVKRDYALVPLAVGQIVKLNLIYFEPGKYDLLPSSFYELDKVVKLMKENKHMQIEIGGHTDDVGNDRDNLTLSQDRASAVMNYLVSKSIEIHRIRAIGYGETLPKVPNDSDLNRYLNRRVEFTILKK